MVLYDVERLCRERTDPFRSSPYATFGEPSGEPKSTLMGVPPRTLTEHDPKNHANSGRFRVALQAGGQGFDSPQLQQQNPRLERVHRISLLVECWEALTTGRSKRQWIFMRTGICPKCASTKISKRSMTRPPGKRSRARLGHSCRRGPRYRRRQRSNRLCSLRDRERRCQTKP